MALAMVVTFATFQIKQERLFRWGFICAGFLAGTHFLLLGAYTAACVVFLNALRWMVSLFSKKRYWIMVYGALTAVILYFTYTSWISLVSFVAGIIGTIAVFQQSQLRMRAILMSVDALWVWNNVLIVTPVGVLAHVLFLGSNFFGHRALKKSSQERL